MRAKKGVDTTDNLSSMGAPLSSGVLPVIPVVIPGVKSWINGGLGLISSGNKQFDDILGGGLALEAILLLETDTLTNYGETLTVYSIAEGLSSGHYTVVVAPTALHLEKLKERIPFNQTRGTSGDVAEREAEESQDTQSLVIAWQYEKYRKG